MKSPTILSQKIYWLRWAIQQGTNDEERAEAERELLKLLAEMESQRGK